MTAETSAIPILDSIACFSRHYDVWLTDIWGVMHNGLTPFPTAVEACQLFRQGGGTVILISNSPRPNETAAEQLREIGVPADCYDAIATSGDVTRRLITDYEGRTVYHLGPERDLPTFDGLPVSIGALEESSAVVCTGLRDDETETPADYADLLGAIRARDLPMICANPDLKVERGAKLIYCAGAIAAAYEELGGKVIYAGKPYKPIYDLALQLASDKREGALPRHRIVAIGDGIRTDIAGAGAQKIDCVYVASALHIEGGPGAGLTPTVISELFSDVPTPPVAATARLSW